MAECVLVALRLNIQLLALPPAQLRAMVKNQHQVSAVKKIVLVERPVPVELALRVRPVSTPPLAPVRVRPVVVVPFLLLDCVPAILAVQGLTLHLVTPVARRVRAVIAVLTTPCHLPKRVPQEHISRTLVKLRA